MYMNYISMAVICSLVAMAISIVMNPMILKLAYKKHLTDNPNYRKLQKRPVPVLGGMSVYVALVVGILFCNFFFPTDRLYVVIASLTVMFFLGFFDDMLDLDYRVRFLCQIGIIFTLWSFGYRIDTFAGLFGVTYIPKALSCFLSIFVGVGLLNSLNMIDGVDGLASSIGILTSVICGAYFFTHYDPLFALLSIVFAASLIPFLVCNVFSLKYKMFIGDSGSLMLGILAYVFSCRIIHTRIIDWNDQFSVSMLIAVYSLPVFDTLRVMLARMAHGNSPFKADKSHLHHMLLDLHYPHIMVTLILVLINLIVIAIWYITSLYETSVNEQFFIVFGSSVIAYQLFYYLLKLISYRHPRTYRIMAIHSQKASTLPLTIRNSIRNLIDGNVKRHIRMRRAKAKALKKKSE